MARSSSAASKAPAVRLGCGVFKILAARLAEIGGDTPVDDDKSWLPLQQLDLSRCSKAFILGWPPGARVDDLPDTPLADSDLVLSRAIAAAVQAVLILTGIVFLPQRAGAYQKARA